MPASGSSDADTGTLLVSLGAVAHWHVDSYQMRYRKRDGSIEGVLFWYANGLDNTAPGPGDPYDFREPRIAGTVEARSLPAGDYEIYYVGSGEKISPGNMVIERSLHSKQNFSVPFSIKPHETTYLGRYVAWGGGFASLVARYFKDRGPSLCFRVSDRQAEDTAIAIGKHATLGNVTHAVPDVIGLGVPLFVATLPDVDDTSLQEK